MEKRKSAVICIILVAVCLLGIFSYMALGGFSFLPEERPENQLISIRLESQQASYALRGPVKVNVYIVNFSNETMKLHGGVLSREANIFDSKGESVVELGMFYGRDIEYYLEVPAQSEVLGDTVEWSPTFFDFFTNSYKYVDPGIYTIRITVRLDCGSFTSDARIKIKGCWFW